MVGTVNTNRKLALLGIAMFVMWLTAVVAFLFGPFPFMIASILWVGGAAIPAGVGFGIIAGVLWEAVT